MKSSIYLFLIVILIAFSMSIPVSASAAEKARMTKAKESALQWIETNREECIEASRAIWNFAEVAFQEFKSSRYHADRLERHGFRVERGVADMPTDFVGTYGSGQPVIGLLAEYDALPGLSQKVQSSQEALQPGAAGHGCGHNLLGTASTSAAIALKNAMERHRLTGTIKIFGCPAEEGGSGKAYMVRAGLFDNVDAVIDWHPGSTTRADSASCLARISARFAFSGLAAHAAGNPEKGFSALDGVELMNVGTNYLREHVIEEARIHYVITDGGKRPNVVPDAAEVWYYVRAPRMSRVREIYDRVRQIADGAARMSGTTYRIHSLTATHEILPNAVLSRLIESNLKLTGSPRFTESEQEYAREVQRGLNMSDQKGIHTGIAPARGGVGKGSTDVGDVSWKVPTGRFGVAVLPVDAPGHSWAFTATAGSGIGSKAMITAAKVIALSAIDLLTQEHLLQQASGEFQRRSAHYTFQSGIPDGQKPPRSIDE